MEKEKFEKACEIMLELKKTEYTLEELVKMQTWVKDALHISKDKHLMVQIPDEMREKVLDLLKTYCIDKIGELKNKFDEL